MDPHAAANWCVHGTFWAFLPTFVAMLLAVLTKEVYSSLFAGVCVGALLISDGDFDHFLDALLKNGILDELADPMDVGIIFFVVTLGATICLMNRSGGAEAFGEWAKKHIKSKVGAQIVTICLGCLFFLDDCFNCFMLGSIMGTISDRLKVSREKFAYLIDATAAPICVIVPISSCPAASISGLPGGEKDAMIFVKSIPFNFYALLTLVMMFALLFMKVDFGPMRQCEIAMEKNHGKARGLGGSRTNATMLDLLLPIGMLNFFCLLGLLYTGGFFASGVMKRDFAAALVGSDPYLGLALGSLAGFIASVFWILRRRTLGWRECMDCLPKGVKMMVNALLILVLAWCLQDMTLKLGAEEVMKGLLPPPDSAVTNFLPAMVFLGSFGFSFATGTSWGTMGLFIPILMAVFTGGVEGGDHTLLIIAIAASLAGAVCGDHCSPISDTTIMASQAAHCDHMNHVKTQLPYAVYVATISFVCFIVAGFTRSAMLSLLIGVALLVGGLALVKATQAALDAWRQKWRGATFALVGWDQSTVARETASREWRFDSDDDDDYDEETTMRVTMDVGDKDDPNITGPQADAFAQELLKIEEAEFKEVVLDFANVETLSSMAMGSLFATYQKLAEQERKLSIVHPRESIRRLLRMFKMDSLIADDGKGAKG